MVPWYGVAHPSRWVAETTGDVAPVGHPEPVRTVIDIALAQFDVVWAAGGHPHYVFPTSYDELLRITGGKAAEIGA
jgi:prolyl-tRNA editing enzyme YbaK/EbsC (Cys-tRNA(Pro) deacylase)